MLFYLLLKLKKKTTQTLEPATVSNYSEVFFPLLVSVVSVVSFKTEVICVSLQIGGRSNFEVNILPGSYC